MCEFFSLLSNGRGKVLFCNAEQRKELLALGKSPDSHSTIFEYFKSKGEVSTALGAEDLFNKYEYNPLTKVFTIDNLSATAPDDSKEMEAFCNHLDFKTIVPELIIKPIVHPFEVKRKSKKVTKKEIQLLKEWASVMASVWDSVASVGDSVWDSVWASVYAYVFSFYDIPELRKYDCCVKLWEAGLVPSFDGKTWRLHSGENAEIVFEISKEDLETKS